jgi:hypothetical protein
MIAVLRIAAEARLDAFLGGAMSRLMFPMKP